MLDSMQYVNHLGETINFGVNGVYINANDFRDYEWTYNSRYKKIVSFERKMATHKLPIILEGSDVKQKANSIFEIIDKDVRNGKPGKVVVNGYSLSGYFYASEKELYTEKEIIKFSLSFVSDEPLWVKENPVIHFNTDDTLTDGLDYNHDFSYDFTSTLYTAYLINSNYTSCDFRLYLFGPCNNPSVQIGKNTYSIETVVEENERIEIDSLEKTVFLVKQNGEKVNVFGNRNKDFNIFELIAPGGNSVSWSSDFSFDVVLIEKRSEPKWN